MKIDFFLHLKRKCCKSFLSYRFDSFRSNELKLLQLYAERLIHFVRMFYRNFSLDFLYLRKESLIECRVSSFRKSFEFINWDSHSSSHVAHLDESLKKIQNDRSFHCSDVLFFFLSFYPFVQNLLELFLRMFLHRKFRHC